jgi:transposase InsO family protein
MGLVDAFLVVARAALVSRTRLAVENLALRQQLAVLRRSVKRPRMRRRDRLLWAWLSRIWSEWRSALIIVKPETVIRWHRQGFRLFWHWRSRPRGGRPRLDAEIRSLIRQMNEENTRWGAPRIQAELALLGHDVSQATVAKYMKRRGGPSCQGWKTFLKNHMADTAAIDFFVVPTVLFRLLYGFIVLRHERREIIHCAVTSNPSAEWTARQLTEAFPWDEALKCLLRDRDGIYGEEFVARVKAMGIEEVVSAPRSPWQNPYVERVIGSIRRECLDHVIVLGEEHLWRILRSYVDYYNADRAHRSLEQQPPKRRDVEHAENGPVVSLARVGGLHHRYTRAA